MIRSLIILNLISMPFLLKAAVLGPSIKEVQFSYTATFEIPLDAEFNSDNERALFHASHLFGLFQSKALIRKFDLNPLLVGGLGAPRTNTKITILQSHINGANYEITYKNTGKMILHKDVAKKLLDQESFSVPMPINTHNIYDPNCTDSHYDTFGDYWYFYDIFKDDCTYLNKEPYSTDIEIKISPVYQLILNKSARIDQIRADNGNGNIFSIYIIQGFSESKKDPADSGRINFNETNNYLISEGFELKKLKSKTPYPLYQLTKTITTEDGDEILIQVNHLLTETSISSKSKVFAEYFKTAVYEADILIYGGHSGLGANLDIPSLEEKAGPFEFNETKKQIFYFDSCSSYSYYLEHFESQKKKSKLDVVTNGLSSYFHTSQVTMKAFFKHLTTTKNKDVSWKKVLADMEKTLDGETYLINVGGL